MISRDGRPTGLGEAFAHYGRIFKTLHILQVLHESAVPWRAEAALVHAALGDTREARRLAGEQLQVARAFGRTRTLGISLRASGLIEGGETGLELLAEAVTTLEGSQSPLELARALSESS
jgi:hypothetical protein